MTLSPQRCRLDGVDSLREVDAKKVALNNVVSVLGLRGGVLLSVLNVQQIVPKGFLTWGLKTIFARQK